MSGNTREELSPKLGNRERDYVFSIAMRFVKNESEADDIAQETLLLAHRHRQSFMGQSKYSTWLYRVACTTSLMFLRSKKRKTRECSESQLAQEDVAWLERMQSTTPNPEEIVAHREDLAQVVRSLEKLGSKYTKLLHLRWFSGYSEKEVSRELRLPLTTVKTRAYRGRRHVLSERYQAA